MDATQDDENLLLGLYRQYVGPPKAERTVYGGFGLFFGGIALALVGIAIFLVSATVFPNDPSQFVFREVAAVAGVVGLPALLLGVTVLLPVDRKALYAAAAGTAICLVGTGLFVAAYPDSWNGFGANQTAEVVAVYAAGIVVVIASTGAALVGHHIHRVSGSPSDGGVAADPAAASSEAAESAETVTDEQVRRDIDEAMADSDLSWGGVGKTKTKRLKLNTAQFDDIDSSNVADVEAKTVRSTSRNVDDAVNAMRGLRGGETKQARSEQTTDDQTAALQALREQQAAEGVATDDDGVVDRLRNLLS